MLHEGQHAFQLSSQPPDFPNLEIIRIVYDSPSIQYSPSLTLSIVQHHTRNFDLTRMPMTAKLLDGATVARAIKDEVASEVVEFSSSGLRPGLAAVLVGNDSASHIYVSNKVKTCEQLGLYSEKIELPETTTTEEVLALVKNLNSRDEIDGILIQLPLPKQIDVALVLNSVDAAKDVDGLHPMNVGRLLLDEPGLRPCTPAGIIEMLERYQIDINGARAVVIGRSRLVGLPVALMMLHRHASVTICHSRTRDLPSIARGADILIAAMGKAGMVDANYIKPGAAVIDVGTNKITTPGDLDYFFGDDQKRKAALEKRGYISIGDVNPRSAGEVAGYLSPVPGGVGPLTIAMLMKNTLTAMKMRRGA
jgi:methylenetetrahydrofolate dehydrogenase (NADP+) / methenyltetrahydrofolate cyclohydrolase